jgi:hypothetical protein
MTVEVRVISDDATPDEIREALGHIAAEAAKVHPSPRHERLHAMIDELLDRLD